MHKYYDQKYFEWQKNIGEFGGIANLIKFRDHINPNANLVDFGCGGGYLLMNINCKNKIGIEVNPKARKIAIKNGVEVVSNVAKLKNNWADIIISNHVLEHTQNPLKELVQLNKKLKTGGKIIFVVPCDTWRYKYNPDDINKHLFSWSPMNLGNIFTTAGFKVIASEPFLYKWPKHYLFIYKMFGIRVFHLLSWIKGRLDSDWSQVRIIATK